MKKKILIAVGALLVVAGGAGAARLATSETIPVTLTIPYTIGDKSGEVVVSKDVIVPVQTVTVTVTEPATPPPPPSSGSISQTIVDGSTVTDITNWRAVYDANGDGTEDDPGSVEFYIDGVLVLSETMIPFGDTFAGGSPSTTAGQHTFKVRALDDAGNVLATNSATATVASQPPPPPPPAGSCAYPNFPNDSCTGIPAGTSLTKASGTYTVTTSGTVVDGRDQAGTIYVNANNVTIQNSRASSIVINTSRSGTVIRDSEVKCPGTGKGIMGGNSSGGGDPAVNVTITRVDVSGCEDAMMLGSNVVVTDNWMHDPGTCCNDPHNDGIQFLGGASNVRIEHNAIIWRDTSDLQMCNNTGCGTFKNVLIKNNYLYLAAGSAYNIYCPKVSTTNFVIEGNAFDENGGQFGYYTDCAGETLVGNYEYHSGKPIP